MNHGSGPGEQQFLAKHGEETVREEEVAAEPGERRHDDDDTSRGSIDTDNSSRDGLSCRTEGGPILRTALCFNDVPVGDSKSSYASWFEAAGPADALGTQRCSSANYSRLANNAYGMGDELDNQPRQVPLDGDVEGNAVQVHPGPGDQVGCPPLPTDGATVLPLGDDQDAGQHRQSGTGATVSGTLSTAAGLAPRSADSSSQEGGGGAPPGGQNTDDVHFSSGEEFPYSEIRNEENFPISHGDFFLSDTWREIQGGRGGETAVTATGPEEGDDGLLHGRDPQQRKQVNSGPSSSTGDFSGTSLIAGGLQSTHNETTRHGCQGQGIHQTVEASQGEAVEEGPGGGQSGARALPQGFATEEVSQLLWEENDLTASLSGGISDAQLLRDFKELVEDPGETSLLLSSGPLMDIDNSDLITLTPVPLTSSVTYENQGNDLLIDFNTDFLMTEEERQQQQFENMFTAVPPVATVVVEQEPVQTVVERVIRQKVMAPMDSGSVAKTRSQVPITIELQTEREALAEKQAQLAVIAAVQSGQAMCRRSARNVRKVLGYTHVQSDQHAPLSRVFQKVTPPPGVLFQPQVRQVQPVSQVLQVRPSDLFVQPADHRITHQQNVLQVQHAMRTDRTNRSVGQKAYDSLATFASGS